MTNFQLIFVLSNPTTPTLLTSIALGLAERDGLGPYRDGGRSANDVELLPLGLTFLSSFNPINTSRDFSNACSPFGRGDGDSYLIRTRTFPFNS